MQKIVIRNFGAIKDAEVDVKKIVVLIGEQASGKSTVAKLIYFFKALSDRVFDRYYTSESPNFLFLEHLVFPVKNEFYNLFGSTKHLPEFEITYYYDFEKNRYIKLSLDKETKTLEVDTNINFKDKYLQQSLLNSKIQIHSIEEQIQNTKDSREHIALTEDKLQEIQNISSKINTAFSNNQNFHDYIIAGRESTVSYQATFESYLEKTLMDALEDNRKKTGTDRAQTVDEILMLDFLREVQRIKRVFSKHGGAFQNIITSFSDQKNNRIAASAKAKEPNQSLDLILEGSNEILKGKYAIDQYGEKIKISGANFVYLKDASSGQKESIRILQYILLSVLENQKFFRVVEEPEAHLFPLAQKKLIELLVLMVNHLPESQLVITTHSPYILTVINNLLFASRVIEKNPNAEVDVVNIIDKEFFIKPELFSVYSLGNSFIPESKPCENIFNEKQGVIKQNYLDTVSEILSADFNRLYSIHARSFSQK